MYVNVAVLKETQPHERRVAPAPSVAPKLIKLGGNKAKQVYVVKRGEGKATPASSTRCSMPTTATWSTATPRM